MLCYRQTGTVDCSIYFYYSLLYVIGNAQLNPYVDGVAMDSLSIMIFINTVKILKIGTPEIITIIVLQLEQLDFTVQYCVQKMQTE